MRGNASQTVEMTAKRQNQRRQILRELRRLHLEEQKEMSQLTTKLASSLDTMLSAFEQERHAISHKYESDLEAMSRQQKMKVEKLEWSQDQERRKSMNTLKLEQKRQREDWDRNLKLERKTLKRTLPRGISKQESIQQLNSLNLEQRRRTDHFLSQIQLTLSSNVESATRQHREQMIKYEKQFLKDRQDLIGKKEDRLCSIDDSQDMRTATILDEKKNVF